MGYYVKSCFCFISISATSVLSPKGLWPLNVEFEAKDLTGHRNHGVSTTNVVYQNDKIKGNLKGFMTFGGSGGSCIEIPNPLDLFLSEFTLLIYVRRRSSLNSGGPILWFDTFGTGSYLAMNAAHRMGFNVVTETNAKQIFTGRLVPHSRWTMVAVTYKVADATNPGILSIWTDGHLAGDLSKPTFSQRLRTGSVIKIGSCEGKTQFHADVAWLQIYDKCLDKAELTKGQLIPKQGR